MKKYKLQSEEQELLDSFEKGILPTTTHFAIDKKTAELAADNFLKKTERINIRLKYQDLNHIKRIAAQEGLPYQTLISSILHKYASGYLGHKL